MPIRNHASATLPRVPTDAAAGRTTDAPRSRGAAQPAAPVGKKADPLDGFDRGEIQNLRTAAKVIDVAERSLTATMGTATGAVAAGLASQVAVGAGLLLLGMNPFTAGGVAVVTAYNVALAGASLVGAALGGLAGWHAKDEA